MTREEEIRTTAIRSCGPLSEWSGSTIDAFIEGAQWADSHPAWRDVKTDPPKEVGLHLASNGNWVRPLYYSSMLERWCADFQGYVDDVTHWMPLPRLPKEE